MGASLMGLIRLLVRIARDPRTRRAALAALEAARRALRLIARWNALPERRKRHYRKTLGELAAELRLPEAKRSKTTVLRELTRELNELRKELGQESPPASGGG
jgi:hypothetical protein